LTPGRSRRNIKNNGEDRHSGQPRGVGCQVWDVRRSAVAAAVAARAPAVLCLQEDKDAMLTGLFATSALAHSTLRCFPQPGQRCEDAPVLALPEDPPGADAPPPAGAPPPWERCCVLWDDALLQCVHAGQFRWRDGRVVLQGRQEGQREHFLPLTWLLLRWRAHVDGRAGCFLVLNAHFEAGHHWLNDVPAKLRSAALFSAVASALRARFGAHVPMLAAGDFNMQKTQLSYRTLVGDPSTGVLPTHTLAVRRAAAARVPVPAALDGGASCDELARFVDVFDAWMHDCPRLDDAAAPAVPAPAGTVGAPELRRARTGGHDGTTWHAFVDAASAVKVSDSMRDTQVQHRSMADGADGGARGHQRHIDAIMFCATASVRGAARVRSACVLKRRTQCGFTGGCALLRLRGRGEEEAADEEGVACCSGEGGWGSDHFPVVADVTLFFQS
jgi:endonuclease/exonuclease/phosphatase family metal-dependent hydrolase